MKKLLVAGCALMVVCAAFLTVRAGAQPAIIVASPQYVTFGMVGLATGQTARLNAFALPVGGPIIAGAYCQVTFAFYDDSGNSLKTGTEKVAQGAAVNYDLAWTDITTSTDHAGHAGHAGTRVIHILLGTADAGDIRSVVWTDDGGAATDYDIAAGDAAIATS